MAAKKKTKATKKKAAAKAAKAKRRKGSARKRLTPRKEAQGLAVGDMPLAADADELRPLTELVTGLGGAALGAYREPLSGRPILLAAVPRDAIEPTPFQRDLSPTHVKRLAEKIEESGSFLDPIIAVRGRDDRLWTPNGRHRLAAAKVLGLRQVTALVSPDESLAFRILALNTEKAHNLKDKSLEVVRMARELAAREPRSREVDWAAQFEAPELLTLGVVYERDGRFAGGAYRPLLRKVDRFADGTLPASLKKREGHAARLAEIDAEVGRVVEALKERGFRSPYLKTYVVARVNPVRFHKAGKADAGPPMELSAALLRMLAAVKRFDLEGVRPGDLALVGAVAGGDD